VLSAGTRVRDPVAGSPRSLFAAANHLFVIAEAAGAKPLIANRGLPDAWEFYDEIMAGDGWLAFFAHANGRFATAESAGAKPLIARPV
jgi:hypothetical protein